MFIQLHTVYFVNLDVILCGGGLYSILSVYIRKWSSSLSISSHKDFYLRDHDYTIKATFG